MVKVTSGQYTYYMDDRLRENLDELKQKVKAKDEDMVIVIDGFESDGKSVFGLQIARFLDEDFNLDRVCFDAKSFADAVDNASKGQCIVFDEAFKGLSSRASMSEVNNLLVSRMMQMRQKNLFVIIILPTIFMLDRYVALFRSKALFHVYRYQGQRGYWILFNRQKKKMLYLLGKKTFDYSRPRSNFGGRFTDYYCVPQQEYRDKKMKALKDAEVPTKQPKYLLQRNICLYFCYKKMNITQQDLSNELSILGFNISRNEISEIITKISENSRLSVSKI